MSNTLTSIVAIWGATLSTIVLLWDVLKWSRSNPRIVANAEFHEGLSADDDGSISYEVRNRGGNATTIEEITLVVYQDGIWGLLGFSAVAEYQSAKHPFTVRLPAVLRPGEVWKGHSPKTKKAQYSRYDLDYEELTASGRLYFKIRCAHSDRLVSGKVRPEQTPIRF